MRKVALVFLLVGSVWVGCGRDSSESVSALLPDENEEGEWSAADTVRAFVGEDLFILINGGAEQYHENGFVQVATQTFENTSGQKISIEIYEMGSVEGATAVYDGKVSPGGEKLEIGDDAILSTYYLNFRQDRYIVTLVGFTESPETRRGLTELARVISAKIG
jgi:hypothetical protein